MTLFLREKLFVLYQGESEAFQGEYVSLGAGTMAPKWLEGNIGNCL